MKSISSVGIIGHGQQLLTDIVSVVRKEHSEQVVDYFNFRSHGCFTGLTVERSRAARRAMT